jgi:hypothetical protein
MVEGVGVMEVGVGEEGGELGDVGARLRVAAGRPQGAAVVCAVGVGVEMAEPGIGWQAMSTRVTKVVSKGPWPICCFFCGLRAGHRSVTVQLPGSRMA